MNLQASDQGITILFSANLNYASLNENMQTYKRALALKQHILLQAKEIVMVDAAGLQALLVFLNALTDERISFEWQEIPPVLQQTARLLGMEQLLKLFE